MLERPVMLATLCLGIFAWLSSLALFPGYVSAQTAPVRLVLDFPAGGVGGTGTGDLGLSTISAAGTTSTLVFQELILPGAKTEREKIAEAAVPKLRFPPSTLGAFFRYEDVHFDNPSTDGNMFSTTLKLAWETGKFSFGLLLPYDRLDFQGLDANRLGAIAFGQYALPVSDMLAVKLTLNSNYIHTFIGNSNLSDVNTYGVGTGVALTLDTKRVLTGGAAVSVQYNADDTGLANNTLLLLKVGTNVSVRVGSDVALNLFGVWTYDATAYEGVRSNTDRDFFDLGLDVAWSISTTWSLRGGYKKVLGLDNFDSNVFFVGALTRF